MLGAKSSMLTPRWYPLRPVKPMQAYYNDPHRFVVTWAGRRSGKTEAAKRRKVRKWLGYSGPIADPLVIFGAPTHTQAKRIWWNDLRALIPSDMIQMTSLSERTITLWNNTRLMVLGLDVPQRVEGVSIDDGVLDEYGDMKPEVWEEHLRPALADRNGSMDFIGVPEGRNHYYDLAMNAMADTTGEWGWHHWTSHLVLPEKEIEAMRTTMDPLTFDQEVNASFINFSGRAYYAFDNARNCRKCEYSPHDDLLLCFDFNVEPGTGSIWQQRPTLEYECIGEVHIPRNSNTEAVARKVASMFCHHEGKVYAYGDATGGARGSAKVAGSDWEIIKRELNPIFRDRFFIRVPSVNPKERVRVNSVNSWCMRGDKPMLFVDPGKAPNVVKDFEGVVLLEGGSGEIDKAAHPKLTHLTDGIGYMLHKRTAAEVSTRPG